MDSAKTTFCIVVTGLPGSGKTTIGRKVAHELKIPLLDKDDYLETLYEERGVGDTAWRQALSRESDQLFQQASVAERAAALVSHWRPPNLATQSGTPVDWIPNSFKRVIELYCHCPAEEATKRFIIRKRHPGHLDHLKSPDLVLDWMRGYAEHLPLEIETLVTVNTAETVSLKEVLERLKQII